MITFKRGRNVNPTHIFLCLTFLDEVVTIESESEDEYLPVFCEQTGKFLYVQGKPTGDKTAEIGMFYFFSHLV